MENVAAVLHGIGDLRLERRPLREPADHEVLLKMEVVGVCQSDVHFFSDGRIGKKTIEKPTITGHEGSGTVVAAGKCVTHLKPGDRVSVVPVVNCYKCRRCQTGRSNLCSNVKFYSSPPVDGILARYHTHAADFCHKLPEHVSLVAGALLEPLSVGIHACRRGDVGIDDQILIVGAGSVGLVTLMAAKAFGANKIVVADMIQRRLEKAVELGADYTVLVHPGESEDNVARRIVDVLGRPPSKCVDCVGFETTTRMAIRAVELGGVLVLVGMGEPFASLPISDLVLKEIDLRGSVHSVDEHFAALRLVESGKADLETLITHDYAMENVVEAFHTARTARDNAIKVLVRPHRSSFEFSN